MRGPVPTGPAYKRSVHSPHVSTTEFTARGRRPPLSCLPCWYQTGRKNPHSAAWWHLRKAAERGGVGWGGEGNLGGPRTLGRGAARCRCGSRNTYSTPAHGRIREAGNPSPGTPQVLRSPRNPNTDRRTNAAQQMHIKWFLFKKASPRAFSLHGFYIPLRIAAAPLSRKGGKLTRPHTLPVTHGPGGDPKNHSGCPGGQSEQTDSCKCS